MCVRGMVCVCVWGDCWLESYCTVPVSGVVKLISLLLGEEPSLLLATTKHV